MESSTKKFEEKRKDKKIHDRIDELIPREPILEGQFEYYVPSSEHSMVLSLKWLLELYEEY